MLSGRARAAIEMSEKAWTWRAKPRAGRHLVLPVRHWRHFDPKYPLAPYGAVITMVDLPWDVIDSAATKQGLAQHILTLLPKDNTDQRTGDHGANSP